METWLATVIIFGMLIGMLLLGLSIAFSLATIGIIFVLLLWGPQQLALIPLALLEKSTLFVLIACPLFILMANFLEVSGIAEDLYEMMYRWLGNIPGGLAIGTVIICAIFAAMAGISGVATVTMGLIALPAMLGRGYDKKLAVGTVCAGGALGTLIPPSMTAIVYGAIAGVAVGPLFMGCMIPGIILALIFVVYIGVVGLLRPKWAPRPEVKGGFTWGDKIASLKAVVLPLLLIGLVLGSIYLGFCTPTEAAGIGAFGAIIACAIRRKFSWKHIKTACSRTLNLTSMVIWIVFGAACYSRVYTGTGAADLMLGLVSGMSVPPMAIIGIMMFIWMILGMFLDPMGMIMLTIPVYLPIIYTLGYDSLWFGVLFIINTEMAYITPPFGFNLFYMKALIPPGVTMGDVYRSVIPFVFCQALCLVGVMFLPELALWLPGTMR